MSFKASLKIVLKADDVIVAESEDVELWQHVLSQMNQPGSASPATDKTFRQDSETSRNEQEASLFSTEAEESAAQSKREKAITKLAGLLDVEEEVLVGACSPQTESPFIHLDKHHWQELKERLPSRGRNAIPSIVIAASILVLWLDEISDRKPSVDDAQSVLDTIDIRDRNPGRGISNCQWLQERNGEIVLNPAKTNMAVAVARAYCKGEKPEFDD